MLRLELLQYELNERRGRYLPEVYVSNRRLKAWELGVVKARR